MNVDEQKSFSNNKKGLWTTNIFNGGFALFLQYILKLCVCWRKSLARSLCAFPLVQHFMASATRFVAWTF